VSNWNLAEAPLSDGEAIPCVSEKTAGAVPEQELVHVCQPVSFCMSGIVWELGLLGVGLAPGVGVGATAAVGADVDCPPHPASSAKARMKRLGRNRFFSFFIWGTLS
jgi:hypothetical protein